MRADRRAALGDRAVRFDGVQLLRCVPLCGFAAFACLVGASVFYRASVSNISLDNFGWIDANKAIFVTTSVR